MLNDFRLPLLFDLWSLLYRSKDVRLPVQLQRAMAAEAEAAREARAKVVLKVSLFLDCTAHLMPLSLQVIAAEGEQKASRALREAAEVISTCPSALQVCIRPPSPPRSTPERLANFFSHLHTYFC